jgi:hypothetical protein
MGHMLLFNFTIGLKLGLYKMLQSLEAIKRSGNFIIILMHNSRHPNCLQNMDIIGDFDFKFTAAFTTSIVSIFNVGVLYY